MQSTAELLTDRFKKQPSKQEPVDNLGFSIVPRDTFIEESVVNNKNSNSIKLPTPNNRKLVPEYNLTAIDDGRIIGRRGFELKPSKNPSGYLHVPYHKITEKGYKSTTVTVHKLVALAFVPNPLNKPCVNHIDGDKLNNHYTNLEWVTASENIRHAIDVLGKNIGGDYTSEFRTLKDQQKLPLKISNLITGNDYWVKAKTNRYKKLIREGELSKLLRLADIAVTKDSPANWFATAASKAAWERTLDYLAKLGRVAQTALVVAQKLGTEASKFIYKQIWAGRNVERWADIARETGRNKAKYFAWLCAREANEVKA